jgi:hypothetical protein
MNNEKTWGGVIYSTDEEEDEEDPIIILAQQIEDLRVAPLKWNDNETMDEAKERKRIAIYQLEKEMWDKIYLKRQKKLGA